MMTYVDRSIKHYVNALAQKTPAPGGGSVAALSLACASGLVTMACAFTTGKERYKKFSKEAARIGLTCSTIQKEALALLDADIKAYLARDMKRSIEVPARICRLSYDVACLAGKVARFGNKNLSSDAALAVSLARAALCGSLSYVRINVLCLKNASKYAKLLSELEALKRASGKRAAD